MHQPPIPAIDRSELRPRRRSFFIVGIIAVVLALAGVGGGVGLFVYAATSVMPDHSTMLTDKGGGHASGPVPMKSGQKFAVFSTSDASWEITCTGSGPKGPARVSDPDEEMNFTTDGRTWHEIARIDVPADGEYQLSCAPANVVSTDLATARYMVGEAPSLSTFFGGLFGGFALLFGVPFVVVVATVIIEVVLGVKRGNHRKRLMAERYGQVPYGRPPNTG